MFIVNSSPSFNLAYIVSGIGSTASGESGALAPSGVSPTLQVSGPVNVTLTLSPVSQLNVPPGTQINAMVNVFTPDTGVTIARKPPET